MGNNSKDTLFQSVSGAGQSANDYLRDSFEDLSLPPSSNTGFTSTALTNPFGKFFLNTDSPKYSYKTLYVKDLVLIQDRTKWVNLKPTYEVIFTESFPGIFAYCFGDIRLRNFANGKSVDVRNIDDGFGVTAIARRAGWILNPSVQTAATADIVVDGVDTGNDLDFSNSSNVPQSLGVGVNKYYIGNHAAANETKNIHDYRITANQTGLLSVAGLVVYFENATADIDLFPGVTYVDKDKKTTTALTNAAVQTIVGRNGGKSLVYKTSAGTYSQITVEAPSTETTATGTINTNLISAALGTGASFPAGSGVVGIASGTSFYVGSVISVSTDTLTMGQTLSFALSGPLYKAWWAGPTIGINASLYALSYSFDPSLSSVDIGQSLGFASANTGDLFFQDPEKKYRVWGKNLKPTTTEGYYGVGFTGTAFLQSGSYASAVELEFAGEGILHATFSINGVAAWGINEGFTGIAKKTIFTDAGPGWNNFYLSTGNSMGGVVVSKINYYEMQPSVGQTLGRLSYYDTIVNSVERAAINATLGYLGTYRRLYSDELYLSGSWGRGTTSTSAGGVFWAGSSTNSVLNFNYYGKNFGVIGTAGATLTITLDGASINSSLNVMKTVSTTGFHSVVLTARNGTTTLIEAVDVMRPQAEISSLQNFLPESDISKEITIFEQGMTPRNPKSGDIWGQNRDLNSVWVYLFGRWNKIQISDVFDDPNAGVQFVKSHGSDSGTVDANAALTSEHFNFTSWYAGVSAGAARNRMAGSESVFLKTLCAIGGIDTSGSLVDYFQSYDKVSWTTKTNPTQKRSGAIIASYLGALYYGCGSSSAAASGGLTTVDRWNGSAWSATVYTTSATGGPTNGCWVSENLLHEAIGTSAGGSSVTSHSTYNGSASVASVVTPSAKSGGGAARAKSGGFVACGNSQSVAFSWSGTAWSQVTTRIVSEDNGSNIGAAAGYNPITQRVYINGGTSGSATTCVFRTDTFDGIAFFTDIASATPRSGHVGGVF